MLYERWCHIASKQPHDVALRDIASGRQWTFGELRAAGETYDCGDGEMVHPQGHAPEFIFMLLAAWRTGKIACPIEPDQIPPKLPPIPKSCAHLKTTSATTGAARCVAFTEGQLAADVDNIVATMGLRPDWPNFGVISMAHSYGFSNLVLPLLLHGIPLILVRSPLPEAVRSAAANEKAVTIAGVPAMWRAWHNADSIPTSVKLAISAGAPLPLALEQEVFTKHGLKIHNFYGSTECGGIAYDMSKTPRDDEACAGSPIQNVNLSVNERKCLVVRSSAVGQSYWPSPSEMLADRRFETTDLAEIKDGLVFLRGRASDLINVAGRKVSPMTIEFELIQHPAVAACLVFGVPDSEAERGDRIVACVVEASSVTRDALKQFMLERVPAWQIPRDWWFVKSLLPNRVGKVSRVEWRAKFIQEQSK